MKISVISGKNSAGINSVSKGDIIHFEKAPTEISDVMIKAFHNGEEIGFVPNSKIQVIAGTPTADEIFGDVPDKFNGVVTRIETKTTTKTSKILEVEISIGGTVATKSSKETIFNFKICGSTTVNPGKSEVIRDIATGGKVYVTFSLNDDNSKIVCSYNGKPAGAVSQKNESGNATSEEREIFKEFLSTSKDIIEGKVVSGASSHYTVSVAISNSAIEEAKVTGAKKAIGGIKQPLIDMGISESILNAVEGYLLDNGFSVENITDIFSTYKMYPEEVRHLIPESPKRLFEDKEKVLLIDSYSSIIEKMNILCSGAKGTGKNVFIETWAWILQRPLYEISINRETDKTDLLGSKTIEPVKVTDEKTGEETYVSKIVFQKEVLLEAMQVGGIINIDEINFADPGVTGLLHSISDTRRSIFVPGYGLVKADDNFVIMATMNVGYNGTEDLNEALADRFVDISFGHNDSIAEILEGSCAGVPKSYITMCDKVYMQINNSLKDAESSFDDNCLTVRGFIQALTMSKRIPLKRALIRCVADKIRDTEYRQNVIDLIETIVH